MNTEQKKYTIKEIEKCNDEEKYYNRNIFLGGAMTFVGIAGIAAAIGNMIFEPSSAVGSTIYMLIETGFSIAGFTIFSRSIAGRNTQVSKRELLEYQLKINELEEYDNQEENERIWVKTKSEYRC